MGNIRYAATPTLISPRKTHPSLGGSKFGSPISAGSCPARDELIHNPVQGSLPYTCRAGNTAHRAFSHRAPRRAATGCSQVRIFCLRGFAGFRHRWEAERYQHRDGENASEGCFLPTLNPRLAAFLKGKL